MPSSPDLSPAVAAAIDALPASGPALVYDLAAVAARMQAVAALGRAAGVRVLFAMKSFPHQAVQALAAAHLDGFDAGSAGEVAALGARAAGKIVSVTDPLGGLWQTPAGAAVVIAVETPDQAAAAPPGARLAVRLAASHLVPSIDAVGGVVDENGHRSSRFGVRVGEPGWRELIADIAAAAPGRVIGAHIHHGGVAATAPARPVEIARAAISAVGDAGVRLEWLNLGGGLHALGDRLGETLTAVRHAVPAMVELVVEPGRLFAAGAGHAVGHVRVAREIAGRSVRVLDLSRACHLRWQRVRPVAGWLPDGSGWAPLSGGIPPAPGEVHKVLFTGPTCYEEDVIGEWKLGPDRAGRLWPEGARLALAGVDGYALAWNSGFGGVPAAAVVLVE